MERIRLATNKEDYYLEVTGKLENWMSPEDIANQIEIVHDEAFVKSSPLANTLKNRVMKACRIVAKKEGVRIQHPDQMYSIS